MAEDSAERQLRTRCPHCGEPVSAWLDAAGESMPCFACGKPVGFPADYVPVSPGAVREPRKPPKPPPLTGWARQWQGIRYAAGDIVFHASFIGLLVLFKRSGWSSCGPGLEVTALVTLFPAHFFATGFTMYVIGANKIGAFVGVMVPIPLSMLYTRLAVRIWRKFTWGNPLEITMAILVLLFILLFFCSC